MVMRRVSEWMIVEREMVMESIRERSPWYWRISLLSFDIRHICGWLFRVERGYQILSQTSLLRCFHLFHDQSHLPFDLSPFLPLPSQPLFLVPFFILPYPLFLVPSLLQLSFLLLPLHFLHFIFLFSLNTFLFSIHEPFFL